VQFGFVLSAVLLITASWSAARLISNRSERFWIFLAVSFFQLGTITSILSLFGALTPRAFLLFQALLVPIAVWMFLRPHQTRAPKQRLTPLILLCFTPIALMVILTGIEKLALPVSNFDDRLYYASRAAYWMQHQSALHWPTHNERQVIFPITDRLPYFWPILFTQTESAGLLVYWLAYPLLAIGMYTLLREMDLSRPISAAGALLLCLTPQVLLQTSGAHSELWVTLFSLGCAFWSLRAWQNHGRRPTDFLWACVFAALAAATRLTALPLILSALLLPLLLSSPHKRRALLASFTGVLIGIVFSGWLFTIIENTRHFGHPLGPTAIRAYHAPTYSPRQLATHAARFVVTLLEPPMLPSDQSAQESSRAFHAFLENLNLHRHLPMEESTSHWPGPYRIQVHRFAEYYSIQGLFWIPALILAVLCAKRLRAPAILALLAIPFLVAVVFRLRWMGVMGRFWVAPYALSLPIIIYFAARLSQRRAWIAVASIVATIITVTLAATARSIAFARAIQEQLNPIVLDEPYAEPLFHIKDGSTILLIAGQGTRDYPLFRPRAGFVNRVISWGRREFDQALFDDALKHADFVIVENDQFLDFDWNPPISSQPFVEALRTRADFTEIPLQYMPTMRLFARRPLQSTTWPARTP
jgi:hypothetical protein